MKEDKLHNQIVTYLKLQYPKVLFMTDLSGIKMPVGLAVKVAKLRSDKGYPDLFIIEPLKGYSGLYIEIKVDSPFKKDGNLKKNEHLENQQLMLSKLTDRGFKAVFGVGFKSTIEIIDKYLKP